MKTGKLSFTTYICFCIVMITIGCSTETEEVSFEYTVEELQTLRTFGDEPLTFPKTGEIYPMLITYVPGTTDIKKNKIRHKYTQNNYIVSVERDYDLSPDIELWYIRTNCPPEMSCRPKVYHPNEPDIESSIVLTQ